MEVFQDISVIPMPRYNIFRILESKHLTNELNIEEKMRKLYHCFILIILVSQVLRATENLPTKKISACKINEKELNFDGKLSESCWQGQPINEFTQRDPEEGAVGSEKTNVWIAYDEKHIYVAARMFDSKPDSIDAGLARRDWSFDSDWFYFFIDPYNDKKTGYYFRINPGGTIGDGVLYNDSWDSDSWDGIWEAKTNLDKEGWTVEMRIPFSQLRYKEADIMTWGVNFMRLIKRKNERDYYVMVPKKESGFVSKFANLEGLTGIKTERRFELLPYFVQKGQYLIHEQNDPYYKGKQYRTTFGTDLKVGIGSNLNLDATINPDFGQVEVDPAVINLSASESYFNEKRPFFIEGANTFEFGFGGSNSFSSFNFGIPELLYTRRIGRYPQGEVSDNDFVNFPGETRILGAAKLTGKINDNTIFGGITAITERTYASLSIKDKRSEEEVEPFTHFGVLRARSEFNDGNQALGFMFTSVNRDLRDNDLKNHLAKEAYVLGIDGWTFLDKDKEYVITGTFAGSYISGSKEFLQDLQKRSYRYFQRPDATYATFDPERTSLTGSYGRLMLNKQKGNFYINSALGAVTPGFEYNDLGFQWMADRINGHLLLGYNWFDPDPVFRRKNVMLAYSRSTDFEGNTISNFIWSDMNFQFLNYYGFEVGFEYSIESYTRGLTRGGPLAKYPSEWNLSFRAFSDSRKDIFVSYHGHYDEDKLGGSNYCSGLSITWKPSPQLYISFEPHFEGYYPAIQWINSFSDETATNTYKNRYVFGEMKQHTLDAGIRVNYTFTPSLSFQLYLQPFISSATYSKFKELSKPRTADFNIYEKSGADISYNKEERQYTIDPDGNGPAKPITLDDPDFNFKSLRGTAVIRWELKPGTSLYLVWTHNRTNNDNPGEFILGRDFKQLMQSESDNILLIKFSYWLNI